MYDQDCELLAWRTICKSARKDRLSACQVDYQAAPLLMFVIRTLMPAQMTVRAPQGPSCRVLRASQFGTRPPHSQQLHVCRIGMPCRSFRYAHWGLTLQKHRHPADCPIGPGEYQSQTSLSRTSPLPYEYRVILSSSRRTPRGVGSEIPTVSTRVANQGDAMWPGQFSSEL